MAELLAVVTTSKREGARMVDSEKRVHTLEDLYEACREAPPSDLVKVSLRGPQGEVRLNFASFMRKE